MNTQYKNTNMTISNINNSITIYQSFQHLMNIRVVNSNNSAKATYTINLSMTSSPTLPAVFTLAKLNQTPNDVFAECAVITMTADQHFIMKHFKRIQEALFISLSDLAENEYVWRIRMLHLLFELHPNALGREDSVSQVFRQVNIGVG